MIRFDQAELGSFGGRLWLMLGVLPECRGQVQTFLEGMEQGKVYQAELKRHRPRRSLDANAYCWALLDKLSAKLGRPKIELYREQIPNVGGNCTVVTIPKAEAAALRKGWERGHLGWVSEEMECQYPGFTTALFYTGSSDYDSAQMSRLIDLVVEECKAQGIETATPQELARLKEEWHGK